MYLCRDKRFFIPIHNACSLFSLALRERKNTD
jgi:hypothetical protein